MKITITGSLGNIGRRLTEQLTGKGHQVTVISHDPGRVKTIEAFNAKAAIGSVEDQDFLVHAFTGADAVFTMIPPDYHTQDFIKVMRSSGKKYARAIEKTGVRYVVNLSGIGADLPDGNGPSSTYKYLERELNLLKDIHVLHLRAGMFYTNFYSSVQMIKEQNIIGNNFDALIKIVLTHPHDIADAAANALDTCSFRDKSIRYIASDERSGVEIAQLLGEAVGKPDLSWITFSDEALLHGMVQNGFSRHMALGFVDMGKAIRQGLLFEHYYESKHFADGMRSFKDFAGDFASVYNSNS